MSRTYRKNEYVCSTSRAKHINDSIYDYGRNYNYYYIYTDENLRKYNEALEEYKKKLARHEKERQYFKYALSCRPWPPSEYDYFDRYYVAIKKDYAKEAKKASDDYNRNFRDGYLKNSQKIRFKKSCNQELRVHNRRLEKRIMKGDLSYEDKPYPGTYMGKRQIWDYF